MGPNFVVFLWCRDLPAHESAIPGREWRLQNCFFPLNAISLDAQETTAALPATASPLIVSIGSAVLEVIAL